jgi:hypothetical protein
MKFLCLLVLMRLDVVKYKVEHIKLTYAGDLFVLEPLESALLPFI